MFAASLLILAQDDLLHGIPVIVKWLEHNPVVADAARVPIELLAVEIVSKFSGEAELALTAEDKILVVLYLLGQLQELNSLIFHTLVLEGFV